MKQKLDFQTLPAIFASEYLRFHCFGRKKIFPSLADLLPFRSCKLNKLLLPRRQLLFLVFDGQLVVRYIQITVVRIAHNDNPTTIFFRVSIREAFIQGESLAQNLYLCIIYILYMYVYIIILSVLFCNINKVLNSIEEHITILIYRSTYISCFYRPVTG